MGWIDGFQHTQYTATRSRQRNKLSSAQTRCGVLYHAMVTTTKIPKLCNVFPRKPNQERRFGRLFFARIMVYWKKGNLLKGTGSLFNLYSGQMEYVIARSAISHSICTEQGMPHSGLGCPGASQTRIEVKTLPSAHIHV